jgi:hypothetical protein
LRLIVLPGRPDPSESAAGVSSFERDLNGRLRGVIVAACVIYSTDYEKIHKKNGKKSGSSSFFYNKPKPGSVKKKHRDNYISVS